MYDKLFEIWKIEKFNKELQSINLDFYEKVLNFVKELKENEKKQDPNSIKSKLLNNEIKRVNKIVSELVEVRFKKIFISLIKDLPPPPAYLTKEEEIIYKKMAEDFQFLNNFRIELLKGKLFNQINMKNGIDKSRTLLRFNKDVPAIMGADMKSYGPFYKEDLATLPIENANALLSRGAAKKINIKK